MEIKDLPKLILSKYKCDDDAMKIFHHLCSAISRKTIFNWCKMLVESGSMNMTTSSDRSRTISTKNMIEKINSCLKRVSSPKLAQQLDIWRTSVRRGWRNDLEIRPYKERSVPLIIDTEKSKSKLGENKLKKTRHIKNLVF